ncbi:hypothetical protein [Xanthocytophaga flava]|uniref:hypothetical protein n=1 Tax=Xanthocytophaga flava TaxID=3048013 RepID=UPI0028D39A29|nr:hypothetical protein [Xanthocytophaga flavus]MDJ1471715.1 hypothetical protein [Xanthocytophaga flavus]
METIYRTSKDTTQNYYLVLKPLVPVKGLLVILPGFGTIPKEVLQETKLPEKAAKAGFVVVIPLLVDYFVVDTTNLFEKRLATLIPEVVKKYAIPINAFIIGGHSLGGHQALRYAEKAYESKLGVLIRPKSVFGVDPPLNMKRLWNSFAYNVRINFSKVSVEESKFMLQRFQVLYGGSPSQKPVVYESVSSYYPEAPDGGNICYLKDIPVRLYCDPDINWVIANRRGSYEYMNASDLSGCISQLKNLGNNKAEFINCLGKGYLPDGRRHPHAFSILDPDEFIEWAIQCL